MSNTNNGGSAFPVAASFSPHSNREGDAQIGMSLRDYFAGRVIGPIVLDRPPSISIDEIAAETAAKLAYMIADAMLKARKL